MNRTVWLIVFGVLVFAGLVIARLPASWVMPNPRTGIACADVEGSIWSGSCTDLSIQNQRVGELTWDLHLLRLLTGKLNADVVLTRLTGTAQGNVEVGFDKVLTARNIKGDLLLDRELASALPANLQTLRGSVHADLTLARLDSQGTIQALEGVLEMHDVTDGEGVALERWGSYSLTFPHAVTGEPVGKLQDLGGPLAVQGSMKLTAAPAGLTVEGLVAPRADAAPDLVQQLRMLGSPDDEGRRQFSFELTF